MKKTVYLLAMMLLIFSCGSNEELKTVPNVDIEKYAGTWYEIAKLPNKFEKGLTCISATYSIKENGKINVLNQGFKTEKGTWKDITGTAWVPDSKNPGQLKVRFFWPFSGDYYIIALNDDYTYALVGDPSRKYLWILSKNKYLDPAIYNELLNIAKKNGFNTDLVEKVDQDC